MFPFHHTHWVWYATVGADERATHAWESLRLFLYPLWRMSQTREDGDEILHNILSHIFSVHSTAELIECAISELSVEQDFTPNMALARQSILLAAEDSRDFLLLLQMHMLHHLVLMNTKTFVANDESS